MGECLVDERLIVDRLASMAIQNSVFTRGLHYAVAVKFRDVILFTQGQEQQGTICQQELLNRRACQFQDRSRVGCLQQITSQSKQAVPINSRKGYCPL
jgi:hypothetical protein